MQPTSMIGMALKYHRYSAPQSEIVRASSRVHPRLLGRRGPKKQSRSQETVNQILTNSVTTMPGACPPEKDLILNSEP